MKSLKARKPRIAGLLALVLGAVALLAVAGVATAKDHGGNGRGDHHGRHHHHLREMREAGTVSSFDATTGKLTIALTGGGTFTGMVTEETEIKCEGIESRLRRDHGGSGSEPGDDNGGQAEPGDDHGGQGEEPGDDNGGRGEEPGDDNGGEEGSTVPSPAPGGKAGSCDTSALVPGALVGDAELRLGSGAPVFSEIDLGQHS